MGIGNRAMQKKRPLISRNSVTLCESNHPRIGIPTQQQDRRRDRIKQKARPPKAAGLRSIQGRRLVAWVLEHFAVKFYLTGRNGVNEASVGVRQIEIYSSITRYEDVFILHSSLSSTVTP